MTTDLHAADLEPSLVDGRTYVTRRRPTRVDAAALLSLMVLLLLLVPARLIVPGMTDLGRPALLVAFALFCWWLLVRFTTHLVMVGPQPTTRHRSPTSRPPHPRPRMRLPDLRSPSTMD